MGKFFTMRYQGGAAAVAAPSITYASSDVTWYDGIAITPLTVTNTGGAVTSYSVDPALPTGVSLNTSTGEISGTPTALDADDTYTITATGPGGEDTFDLTAEVVASLLTGLVAYWNLDEASGDRADSHTNGLDLTDNNTVTSGLGVDGVSTAASFTPANSEYLSRASSAEIQTGDIDFTVACWVNLSDKSTFRPIVQKGVYFTSLEYALQYDSSIDRFRFIVDETGNASSQTQVDADTLGAPSTSTWYFVVAWHDATANTINIQVNNGTADSAAWANGMASLAGALLVGADTALSRYFSGLQQSTAQWKRLLTADEKTWLYNSGSAARTYAAVAAWTG